MSLKIVSLFDGMSCGQIAFKELNIPIEKYYAYEIDPYAIKTTLANFPETIELGDVFQADFSQYQDIDWLIGGSPCTYWSVAQKNNRETEASGLGWELFSQYVRALKEIKPKYFLYENNHSMSDAIRDSIREAFGFEEVCINSALVSAQKRLRYYWVGKRNKQGTYDRVDINQPQDLRLVVANILDKPLKISFGESAPERVGCLPSPDGTIKNSQANRIYSINGKSVNQVANGGGLGAKTGLYAIPTMDGDTVVHNETFSRRGRNYPIKVPDGKYIIRKLSVSEGKRLQTVPDWYKFPVSNTQAYKMLGNGWTVKVIEHIIKETLGGQWNGLTV